MNWGTILAILGSLGGVAGIAALAKIPLDFRRAPVEARRTDAEAGNLSAQAMASISAATSSLVDPLVAQIKRMEETQQRQNDRIETLETTNRDLSNRVHQLQDDRARSQDALLTHAAVDFVLIQRCKDAGIDISDLEPLPPLTLPAPAHPAPNAGAAA